MQTIELYELEAFKTKAVIVIRSLLSEFDKMTRYGSPIAKGAMEHITMAREFLETAE